MKKYRPVFFIIAVSCLIAFLIFYFEKSNVQDSITYFPEDMGLSYDYNETELSAKPAVTENEYELDWKVQSQTHEKVYLREDLSLLYKDGRLLAFLTKWQEDTQTLEQEKRFKFQDSGKFKAISFHHAEKHQDDHITGKDVMSYDYLSVMANGPGTFQSFQIPITPEEQEWQAKNDRSIQDKRQAILKEAEKKFQLILRNYYIFPLSHLHVYNNQTLPGLDKKTTHRAISQLWEGLYKNYVLGIKIKENQIEKPIGSTMPLIMYDKKATHFLILVETKEGELALYRQKI
ncbi:hypothetical protein EV207_10322 [Scopulibacillus darangshiensis]|uniref:Uncharacterized protein n=1 Tax=Scopulibacillus darangshiensis TaxID=442528 RepID=A0A4R2PAL9_9BACL|nr:hypothetical protein [Scopulibacillus darangshiensis]TCP31141.1 hypothetical protein EV207_10322 [Scopulibacillus darangshiensis]